MQTFCLTVLTSNDFYALYFIVLRKLIFALLHVSAGEHKWRQFTTKSQMKGELKLQYALNFFSHDSGI